MEDTPSSKKRSIKYSTFLTWKGEFDKEFQLCIIGGCEPHSGGFTCSVCAKFECKIETMRNYSDA